MTNNLYKPSNSFTVAAFFLMIASTAIVGSLLSFVYLKINQINPIIYLSILCALGYGALLGLIANFFIVKLKLRNPSLAVLAIIIGGLMFTYVKWAVYCNWDWAKIIEVLCKEANMSESSFYKQFPDAKLDLLYFLGHPKDLWDYIKSVAEDGRWTIGRRSTTYDSNVRGTFLWIVWIAEAVAIIGVPALMVHNRSSKPFIESDDDWALEFKGTFKFSNFNVQSCKTQIIYNPDELFNYPSIIVPEFNLDYVACTLYHSRLFDECYLTVSQMKYNPKNKNYNKSDVISYLSISSGTMNRLFEHCKVPKPFESATSADYSTSPTEQSYTSPYSYATSTAYDTPADSQEMKSIDPDEFFK